jgi:hypothetical protein
LKLQLEPQAEPGGTLGDPSPNGTYGQNTGAFPLRGAETAPIAKPGRVAWVEIDPNLASAGATQAAEVAARREEHKLADIQAAYEMSLPGSSEQTELAKWVRQQEEATLEAQQRAEPRKAETTPNPKLAPPRCSCAHRLALCFQPLTHRNWQIKNLTWKENSAARREFEYAPIYVVGTDELHEDVDALK